MTEPTFKRFNQAEARELRATVQAIFEDAYAEAISGGGEFESVDAFMNRFDSYSSPTNTGFELVIAYDGEEPVGQTWGWPLGPTAGWWIGLVQEPEPDFAKEDGTRTFALSEIMVRRAWTGRGLAHALQNALLSGRKESRATLLVEPDNTIAYRAYMRWGWRRVADYQPKWPGAPLMHVLIRDLPV